MTSTSAEIRALMQEAREAPHAAQYREDGSPVSHAWMCDATAYIDDDELTTVGPQDEDWPAIEDTND